MSNIPLKDNHSMRFEGLDVLRGIAAVCVVLSHYSSFCIRNFGEAPFHVTQIQGYYAVLLFFMISGFVIFFTVERSRTWRDFAFSRLTRLYPAYWVALTTVVAAEVLLFKTERMWWGSYIVNMTMLQEFVGFENHDIVYWSLTVELAFYVIIGLLFKVGLLHRIIGIALTWLVASWMWSLTRTQLGIPMPVLDRYLLLQYAPFFLLGIMLYLMQKRGVSSARLSVVFAAFATLWLIHGLEVLAVSLFAFAFAVFAVTKLGRFLVSPVTLWLGAISYSLYLTHRMLGYMTMWSLHKYGLPTWMVLFITIVGALALASILTYLVERPVCAFLRREYSRRTDLSLAS